MQLIETITETDYYILSQIEEHYFNVHYKNKELPLQDYLVLIGLAEGLRNTYGKVYLLYTQEPNFSIETETWAYIKENAHRYKFIGANALVVVDLPQRLMTKLYTFFAKNNAPTKIFTDPSKGLEWLKEISRLNS
ncbi:MAG: hypothetical protein GQ574_14070 [Crocinitomix sp.]|nr:hypothetical protein [Crocinitomix sp.]